MRELTYDDIFERWYEDNKDCLSEALKEIGLTPMKSPWKKDVKRYVRQKLMAIHKETDFEASKFYV